MNNDNFENRENEPDQSTQQWFNSIDPPVQLVAPVQEESSKSRFKLFIVVVVGLLVVSGIILAYVMLVIVKKTPEIAKCINNDYFKELTGQTTESRLSSGKNFYTETIAFSPETSDYLKDNQAEIDSIIVNVGKFYKKYSSNTKITVTITSSYMVGNSPDVSNSRIKKLKQDLIANGVSESAINTPDPKPFTPEDEEVAEEGPTLISVSSTAQCT
ncbi:hypothetical protein KC952_02515 [Candidatus Saccharibacteria bacterium]|nr:hypothetical protein [Candidatus Saccharibacteria bacterium]